MKPHIKSEKTKEFIDIVMDYERLNTLTRKQLIEATQNIQTLANTRIANYLRSGYYKETKEAGETDNIPTPAAYRLLVETKGEISKYSMEDIKSMSVNELRKRLVEATQFVTSESSILGNKYFGQKRILKQREEMFTAGIYEGMDKKEVMKWKKSYGEYIKSEEFSKIFWKAFAQLEELTKFQSFRYSKEYVGKMITKTIIQRKFFDYDEETFEKSLASGDLSGELAFDLQNLIKKHIKAQSEGNEDTVQERSPVARYRNSHTGEDI